MIALDIKTLSQKKTDHADLLTPLSKFLSTHQDGAQKLKQHQENLNRIQQHRNELRNLQDRSEGSRDLCIKYATEVEHLASHFPINSGANRIQITFSWYDSFTRTKVSQGNCFYEQACTLFNAAVIEHQLGASQNRQTEEGVNLAVKHFQSAAGIFQFIKDRVSGKIVEKITNDITAECLDCLINLCLANAQQCIVEKAHKKGMKPMSVAQLAYDAACQYAIVQTQISSGTLKPTFGKSWETYVSFCKLYYDAFTVYQMSLADRETDEVGNELSRLERALQIIKQAQQFKVSEPLKNSLKGFEESVIKAFNNAQRENQKVYHYKVPKYETLAEVQRRRMSKAVIIEDLVTFANVPDMFSDLFPIPVIEATKRYVEQVRNKEQSVFKNAREHRDVLKNQLAGMGLPGSIMATESKAGFPQEVHTKIQAINKQGGLIGLEEERTTLVQMATVTRELCENIKRVLEKEAADDQTCREQYGSRWARLPSSTLTQNMYKALNDHFSKVNAAANADKLIDDKINKWKPGFANFERTPSELNAILPQPDNNGTVQQVVTDLKRLYDQLEVMFNQEQQFENDIRNKSNDVAPVQEFLLKEQSRLELALQEKIAEIDRDLAQLPPMAAEEDKLMMQIVGANNVFVQSKNQSNLIQEREHVIQSVYDSINRYNEVMANIKEGKTFYQAMQDILEKLKQKAEDFAFARETNKQDIIENLKQQPVPPAYIMPQQSQQPQPSYNQQQQQPPRNIPPYNTGVPQYNNQSPYGSNTPPNYQQQQPPYQGMQPQQPQYYNPPMQPHQYNHNQPPYGYQ